MAYISCPKCGVLNQKAGFPAWVIIVSICFFPVGLLSLLSGRKTSRCTSCGFLWDA